MNDTYKTEGFEVITFNLDQNHSDAERFLEQFHPGFDVRFDPNGDVAEFYKLHGMPSSMLIDRHGVTRYTHIGFRPIDGPVYEAQIRELLAEK